MLKTVLCTAGDLCSAGTAKPTAFVELYRKYFRYATLLIVDVTSQHMLIVMISECGIIASGEGPNRNSDSSSFCFTVVWVKGKFYT